jgi:hypothetical protein
MSARAVAFCREPSAGDLNNGRTDIDVMIVTAILSNERSVRDARMENDPTCFAQPLIHYDDPEVDLPGPQP